VSERGKECRLEKGGGSYRREGDRCKKKKFIALSGKEKNTRVPARQGGGQQIERRPRGRPSPVKKESLKKKRIPGGGVTKKKAAVGGIEKEGKG